MLAIIFAISIAACSEESEPKPEAKVQVKQDTFKPSVVYGDDDRLDLYQVEDKQILGLAKSTVGLIRNSKITTNNDGSVSVKLSSYKSDYNLCPSEPFYEQQTAAFCSGFLVAPNVIITAGHCIEDENDCAQTSFLFDFAINNSVEVTPSKFSAEQVYKCSKVLASAVNGYGADFAVVQIDRDVVNRSPLSLRTEGEIETGTPLFVVGHPAGLPTKVAGGANVRKVLPEHFVANLDTYGGNSGSAVFNSSTGNVEGILVRGETDYAYQDGCYVSNVCTDLDCRGEDVTRIDKAVVDKLLATLFTR